MTDFSDRDIDATVRRFEAAATARKVDVPSLEIGLALLALDHSNQDQAVLDLGRAVTAKLGCSVLLTYAGEQSLDAAEHDRYLAQRASELAETGSKARHERVEGDRAFQQILVLAERHACGLIVFPSPYLEDFADVGRASVGTTTDVLLHRRSAPLLIVRKPAETVRERLENIVLPLNLVASHGGAAAAWALALVPPSGTIHLLAVIDEELLETMRALAGPDQGIADLDESTLAGLGRPEVAGLIAVVQRQASAADVDCRLTIRQGPLIPTIKEFANAEPHLLVLACGKECATGQYQQTLALIRESANPVLLV